MSTQKPPVEVTLRNLLIINTQLLGEANKKVAALEAEIAGMKPLQGRGVELPAPAYRRLSDLQSGIDDWYSLDQLKTYAEDKCKQNTEALQAMTTERDALKDDLIFVERWANHHGQKPCHTPQEILSVIQHYPAIKAITKSYSDGVLPTTPDPFAERDALKADAELGRIAMRFVDRAGDYCDIDPAERICDQFYKAMADQVTAHRDSTMKGKS